MSVAWDLFFRVLYRILRLFDPAIAWWVRRLGFGRVVELWIRGRRSGRERRLLVTLLEVGGVRYVGHPNGECQWVRNLAADGSGVLVVPGRAPEGVVAVRLRRGPERDAAIRATWTQQPPGGDAIYRLARRHVQSRGVYFRLEPAAEPATIGPLPVGEERPA